MLVHAEFASPELLDIFSVTFHITTFLLYSGKIFTQMSEHYGHPVHYHG